MLSAYVIASLIVQENKKTLMRSDRFRRLYFNHAFRYKALEACDRVKAQTRHVL